MLLVFKLFGLFIVGHSAANGSPLFDLRTQSHKLTTDIAKNNQRIQILENVIDTMLPRMIQNQDNSQNKRGIKLKKLETAKRKATENKNPRDIEALTKEIEALTEEMDAEEQKLEEMEQDLIAREAHLERCKEEKARDTARLDEAEEQKLEEMERDLIAREAHLERCKEEKARDTARLDEVERQLEQMTAAYERYRNQNAIGHEDGWA